MVTLEKLDKEIEIIETISGRLGLDAVEYSERIINFIKCDYPVLWKKYSKGEKTLDVRYVYLLVAMEMTGQTTRHETRETIRGYLLGSVKFKEIYK